MNEDTTDKPNPKPEPTRIRKTTISAPSAMIDAAIEKAKSEERTFSGYCRNLIQKDLAEASN